MTYNGGEKWFQKNFKTVAKFFRLIYVNGATNQTFLRMQCRFYPVILDNTVKIDPVLIDSFNRLKTSEPYTTLEQSHILGKNILNVHEVLSGSGTSVYDANASCINMAVNGVGSVVRRSRQKGLYQPGKSLLIYMTGILNNATNGTNVTTKIGYYDTDGGYYFKNLGGIISVVERTSVTGTLVENIVAQSSWNMNKLLSTDYYTLDVTKTVIFWISLIWLGVGTVTMGVMIDDKRIPLHSFRHSNSNSQAYIQTASLPITYEISSLAGSVGSLKQLCYTVISEGGFNPLGYAFTAGMGTTTKSTQGANTLPLVAIRLKTGNNLKVIANMTNTSVLCTTAGNSVISIYKFDDLVATSILTGSSFVSANADSAVEYDVSATAISLTGGALLQQYYFSDVADTASIIGVANAYLSGNILGVSDLIVLCVNSIGSTETYLGSITWKEVI